MQNNFKTTVIGLGYIGLPTAALIASRRLQVTGVDISKKVVDTINQGKIHIVEPDLEGLVSYVVSNGYLKAQTEINASDVFVIAVPTPFNEDKTPDLTYVQNAVENIIPVLEAGNTIIIESTSPVGTTEKMAQLMFEKRPDLKGEIHIAYCPERVLPGHIIHELEHNDRVIGGVNEASGLKAKAFYQHFVKGDLFITNDRTAEMCKLVENASRDSNIAFANELSIICDEANIDVYELIRLANRHPRVNILKPGPGVGGHCIAVDPWFIVSEFPKSARMIRLAREINDGKTEWVIDKVSERVADFEKRHKRKPVVACLGLAFKPNIDDLRESPALHVVFELIKKGFNIKAVEPNIHEHGTIKLYSLESALASADIVVFLVAHNQFKDIQIMANHLVFCDLS
ncbi:MAG: UDP-N-acetyl-D-mannosamine dehydrogenase [Fulvivirga sp.]|uniref:UDP-N-acetyl-D-mannosamine dehydrogenase n=1 Tax=Fulvivirga sp. TaxID=1931237 RepID=UPI0032EBEC13